MEQPTRPEPRRQPWVAERLQSVALPQDPRSVPGAHACAPPGWHIRGVSTLVDGTGAPVQQWIKTGRDSSTHIDQLLEALKDLPADFAGGARPVKRPQDSDRDLLVVYPLADAHIGMHSWRDETGQDYDVRIAERVHVEAVDKLVSLAPPAQDAIVVSLGDWYHADDSRGRTLRAGNVLDVDSRWSKVLAVGLRTMRRCIDRALEKHGRVRVLCRIGNHDDHSSVFLAHAMSLYYERDERVSVDVDANPFGWARHGKCLLGFAHGDEAKPPQLPAIMAADRAEDWGATVHRRWYTGHVHHLLLDEHPGCTVESLSSLCARDAWAHRAGYRARRAMRCDVWHRDRGDVLTHRVGVEELDAA